MQTQWRRESVALSGALLLSVVWLGFGCSSASSGDPNNDAGAAGANTAGANTAGASGSSAGVGGGAAGSGTAGSNTGSGGSSGATAVTAACAAFAATNCAHYHDCLGLYFSDYYASVADCQTVVAKYCPLEIAAPGSSRTAEQLSACAQATMPQTCESWINTSPPVCLTPGAEPNGASCEYSRQCASTFCHGTDGAWCGKCEARVAEGQPCFFNGDDDSCDSGLHCARTCPGGTASCAASDYVYQCVVPKLAQQACVSDLECLGSLNCTAGICAARKQLGETCDVDAQECSYELYCVAAAGTATCVKPTFVPVGSACDAVNAVFCQSTGSCADGTGLRASKGTCKPKAGPGGSCASVGCLAPAECVSNVCVVPQDAATCP